MVMCVKYDDVCLDPALPCFLLSFYRLTLLQCWGLLLHRPEQAVSLWR
jgi:hypothetical protein